MKNKLFMCMLGLILVAGIFAGCGTTVSAQGSEAEQTYPENMGFELVYESPRVWNDDPYYAYYRDRVTNVMYVWVGTGEHINLDREYMAGGFSVMLDPNTGGPLTYEVWLELTDGGQPQLPSNNQG